MELEGLRHWDKFHLPNISRLEIEVRPHNSKVAMGSNLT